MYGAPGYYTSTPSQGANIAPNVATQMPKKVFRYGESALWSTARFAGGSALANAQARLYSIAIGQTGLGLVAACSISESNLRQPGVIPEGVGYDVFGVSMLPMFGSTTNDTGTLDIPVDDSTLIAALVNVLHNAVATWNFTQTEIDIACLHLIGAGGGAYGAVATTQNAVDAGHMNNGTGNAWYYRQNPIALPGQSTFSVLLKFGSRAAAVPAANDLFVKSTLLGYYKNVIEVA